MTRRPLLALLLFAAVPTLQGQEQTQLRTQLQARGLPNELVNQVEQIAADASAQGIPAGPIADKAIEGWAKRVPPQRIAAAVRLYAGRMVQAQEAVRAGGMTDAPGHVVAAATEAMAQGIEGGHVQEMVRAAPGPEAAGSGMSVATALRAQGMPPDQAAAVVIEAWRRGETVAQVLDMPSLARAMQAQGMSPAEVGQRMMHGSGAMQGGQHGRPSGVPPPERPGRGQQRPPGQ